MPGPNRVEIENDIPVRIWNTMGGQIDWSALPVLCEVHGVDDVERLIRELIAIRAFMDMKRAT